MPKKIIVNGKTIFKFSKDEIINKENTIAMLERTKSNMPKRSVKKFIIGEEIKTANKLLI